MTQTITTQRRSIYLQHLRLYGLICMFLIAGITGLQAQKVAWTSGFPKMTPATMAALGDPASIEAYFTVTQNIPNAKLEVTLPANVAFGSVTNGTNLSSGITYTATTSGTVATGQVVSIAVTSNSGTLTAGQMIDLNISVAGQCIESTSLATGIKVFSGVTEAQDGVKSVPTPVRKPTIRLQAATPSIAGGAPGTLKSFSMALDAQNVSANSMKITFSADQYTTLSNFQLGATILTASVSGSNPKLFTLTLNTANMGGSLTTIAKTLTFDVVSTKCGAHNVTSSIQYPETSACATSTGTPLSITYDGVAGVPNMKFISAQWVDPTNLDVGIVYSETSLDGVNPAWMKVTYQNVGSADSYNTTVGFSGSHGSSQYGYIDIDNVQYAIGTGAKKILKDNGIIIPGATLADTPYRILKPGVAGKLQTAGLRVTEALPVGATIYYYVPVIQGAIFDNSSMTGSNIISTPYYYIQQTNYPLSNCENACGVTGNTVQANSSGATTAPKFSSNAQSISLRPGGISGSTSFKFYYALNGSKSMDFNIQLPEWLELDGSLTDAVVFTTPVTKQVISTDDVNKKYVLRISNSYSGIVSLKYKSVATCPVPTNENKEGKVVLSIDYNTSDGNPIRPTLEKIGQLVIPATLLCKEEGFVMTNFSVLRTSKGQEDTDNKNLSENGLEAPDNEIDHSSFMANDEGKMIYEGHISGTYNYLYTLISTQETTFPGGVILKEGTLEIGSSTYPITFIQASDNKHFYVKYTGSDIVDGAMVKITLPFQVKAAISTGISFKGEAYTSNDNISTASVFTPTIAQRKGDDTMSKLLFSYTLDPARDGATGVRTINDNLEREFTIPYLDVFHANNFPSPFFVNEYRVVAVPKKVEITIPDGLLVNETADLRMYVQSAMDAHALANRNQYVGLTSVETVTGGKKYTYDLSSVYDPTYNLTQGALPTNKWAYPSESWLYYWYQKMVLTKGAEASNPVQTRVYYDDKTTNTEKYADTNYSIAYTGQRTALSVSPAALETYSANVSIPSVTPGNPNTTPIRMWLYVDGDVKNAKATPVGGGSTISGGGFNNCWIPLGSIAANAVPAYAVDFTYTGSGDCSAYDVKIYTISDFGDAGFNPATSSAMVFDIDHNGAYKTIKVTPNPNAKLTGTLSVPTSTVLSYQDPFTLTATFNSVASEAGVNNAEMLITVPAGQKYVAGSAKFVYPTTASPATASAIETALVATLGATSDLTVARTFALKASDLGVTELPGYKVTGFDDTKRELKVTMDFTSECGTEMNGIRFTGTLSGKNPCGGPVANSDVRTAQLIYTNVTAAYAFQITATMDATGGRVFNEQKTTGTLTITSQKLGNDPVQTTDYLLITLPEELNITGGASSIALSGTLSGVTTATVSGNTVAAGIRTLKLTTPAASFNGATNAGNGLNVVYTIPLTYTPNGQTYAGTPIQKIEPRVISNQKFNAACSGSNEIAIGQAELNIALLTAASNPVAACLNAEAELEITSAGFSGGWYAQTSRTTSLGTGNTYSYTPTVQQDTVFYVSAIFNSVDYGTVPVKVQMNPEATITVTNPSAICLGSSVNLSSGIVSGTPSGSTVKYYSDAAAITELTGAGLTVSPTTATTYYAQVTTTQGCKSLPTAILVSVNPLPVITLITDKTDDKVCIDTDITFTTESAMTNYVWNLGGATVTTSGGTSTSNTAVLQWNTSGTKTVTVNYTDANGCTATAAKSKSITVMPATVITTQPAVDPAIKLSNGYIIPGSNVSLNVVAATGPTLTYQWYWKKLSDGTVVTLSDAGKYSGTTSSTLLISNAYEEENGDYYVTVTGCGTTTSAPVTVIAVANQDASLKDLKIDGTTLWDFNPAVTSYMTTVVCAQEQVTILGIPNNPNYTSITGNGTFQLAPGDNLFTITVVAQDMVTTMTYTVNVIRDCYIPKILKDLEDAVICVGDTHTFEIDVQGENLTYEWYYGLNRIMGANTNSLTISDAVLGDYERYYVVIRSHYNGFKSSAFSKKVRLWVADQLPTHLKFSDYPNPAITGNTYHIKVDGYTDVTKYTWSYDKEGVSFSPGADLKWGNEAWGTFGTLSAGNGILKVTMEHPCGTRELILPISVKYPTGTEDVTATTVQVYPNPTSGILKVSGTEMNQQIRVLDITGSLKGTYKSMEGTTTIDLTGYAKGTYMVQYDGKTYKVIKK